MASITLTSGSTSRPIELLDEVNDADAVNVHIGDYFAELTTDTSLAGDTPRLKFSKNGTDYWIREVFAPPPPPPNPDGVGDVLITPEGRFLQRHSSGTATIVTWYNYTKSQYEHFAVLDAQYRSKEIGGDKTTEVDLPIYAPGYNSNGNWYLDGMPGAMSTENGRWPCTMTDRELYVLWKDAFDINTARYNTTKYVETSEVFQAAHYCRTVLLDGISCDLPNIQQLMVISLEADQIDSLDPTVEDNPHRAFGSACPYGYMTSSPYMHVYWSSTYFGVWAGWVAARISGGDGLAYGTGLVNSYGAIPILEL